MGWGGLEGGREGLESQMGQEKEGGVVVLESLLGALLHATGCPDLALRGWVGFSLGLTPNRGCFRC